MSELCSTVVFDFILSRDGLSFFSSFIYSQPSDALYTASATHPLNSDMAGDQQRYAQAKAAQPLYFCDQGPFHLADTFLNEPHVLWDSMKSLAQACQDKASNRKCLFGGVEQFWHRRIGAVM